MSTVRAKTLAEAPSIETLSAQELARRLGVHDKTIRRWCQRGEIPAHCYLKGSERGHYRFFADAVRHWTDHGEWPTRRELTTIRRARRRLSLGDEDRVRLLVALRIEDLVEELEEVDDLALLHRAMALEISRRGRKGALAAIGRRLAELQT